MPGIRRLTRATRFPGNTLGWVRRWRPSQWLQPCSPAFGNSYSDVRLSNLEEQCSQRGECQVQRKRSSVSWNRFGLAPTHVSHTAAGVFMGVTVQQLSPIPFGGYSHPIPDARHRSEVENGNDGFLGRTTLT